VFVGSIPQELRQIVHEHVAEWPVKDVYVGCSGNLTVERTLEGLFTLHGNDVSLYTGVVASWLAGQPFRLEATGADWEWLNDEMRDPLGQVATIMLCTRMFERLDSTLPYYARMRDAYIKQWPGLYAKTREKLEAVTLRLGSYFSGDVGEYIDSLPQDAAVVSFPPFYTGGYEALYKGLEEVFDWDEPSYPMMDTTGLHGVLAKMREKDHWFYATDHRLEGAESDLKGILEKRGNVPIFVYSSGGPKRVVTVKHEMSQVFNPRLSLGQEITGPLTVAKLDGKQYNGLRAQYLAPNILGQSPTSAFAIMDAGRILGVCAFKPEDSKVHRADMFLTSDFPVEPTDYPRLSKLVVMVALSTEVKALLERQFARRLRTLVTSAFTDNPVSMKYRGIFELIRRDEDGGQGRKYKLVYKSDLGRWTLAEALEMWRKKHGRRAD
jgi:hypothetical protein